MDWGMDETVDVDEWRQGAVEEAVVAGEDDVISLDGADEGEGKLNRVPVASRAPREVMRGMKLIVGMSRWHEARESPLDLTS